MVSSVNLWHAACFMQQCVISSSTPQEPIADRETYNVKQICRYLGQKGQARVLLNLAHLISHGSPSKKGKYYRINVTLKQSNHFFLLSLLTIGALNNLLLICKCAIRYKQLTLIFIIS